MRQDCWAWWHRPLALALRKPKEEGNEPKVSLNCGEDPATVNVEEIKRWESWG